MPSFIEVWNSQPESIPNYNLPLNIFNFGNYGTIAINPSLTTCTLLLDTAEKIGGSDKRQHLTQFVIASEDRTRNDLVWESPFDSRTGMTLPHISPERFTFGMYIQYFQPKIKPWQWIQFRPTDFQVYNNAPYSNNTNWDQNSSLFYPLPKWHQWSYLWSEESWFACKRFQLQIFWHLLWTNPRKITRLTHT